MKILIASLFLFLSSLFIVPQNLQAHKPEASKEETLLSYNQLSSRLSEGMDTSDQYIIRNAVGNLPPTAYTTAFLETIQTLSEEMGPHMKANILGPIATLSQEHYPAFIALVRQFTADMSPVQRSNMIPSIAQVPPKDYADFIKTVNYILWDMHGWVRAYVIHAVSRTPRENYSALKAVGRIMEPAPLGNFCQRFIYLPPEEQLFRIVRSLLFSRWSFAENKDERLMEILETPLETSICPVAGIDVTYGDNPYRYGIGVHAEGRDRATLRAYESLYSLWRPTCEEIQGFFRDCVGYVKRRGNSIALQVLMGEQEDVPSLPGFGSLLQGGGLALENNLVPPHALVAHLWHFINGILPQHFPEEDVENARQSFLGALVDSFESHHVVCDPGKLQRIATCVLQGRLQGVNIDGLSAESVRMVPLPSSTLNPDGGGAAALVETRSAGITPIRDSHAIAYHMQPLLSQWNHVNYPRTAQNLFQQTFDFLDALAHGRVLHTNGDSVTLDPRDVVFYMIYGRGISQEHPQLALEYGFAGFLDDMFRVDDYQRLYESQEKEAHARSAR